MCDPCSPAAVPLQKSLQGSWVPNLGHSHTQHLLSRKSIEFSFRRAGRSVISLVGAFLPPVQHKKLWLSTEHTTSVLTTISSRFGLTLFYPAILLRPHSPPSRPFIESFIAALEESICSTSASKTKIDPQERERTPTQIRFTLLPRHVETQYDPEKRDNSHHQINKSVQLPVVWYLIIPAHLQDVLPPAYSAADHWAFRATRGTHAFNPSVSSSPSPLMLVQRYEENTVNSASLD